MSDNIPYYPTYGEALAAQAKERPNQIALRFGERTTDFRTYDRHATQIANGLAAMGLNKEIASPIWVKIAINPWNFAWVLHEQGSFSSR